VPLAYFAARHALLEPPRLRGLAEQDRARRQAVRVNLRKP